MQLRALECFAKGANDEVRQKIDLAYLELMGWMAPSPGIV